MKNTAIAVFLTLCIILSISHAAFAEDETDNPIITTTNSLEIIPVHGYVGPTEDILTPETEIYVEVPAKILFAAFESDDCTVTSPNFTIKNLSAANDIKVEIENFEQRMDLDIDLDGNLSLVLLNDNNEEIISDLFPSNYSTAKLLCANLPKYEEDSELNQLTFTLGGIWSGSFDTKLHPVFDITIKFSAVD